jgi:hypothetical protein
MVGLPTGETGEIGNIGAAIGAFVLEIDVADKAGKARRQHDGQAPARATCLTARGRRGKAISGCEGVAVRCFPHQCALEACLGVDAVCSKD